MNPHLSHLIAKERQREMTARAALRTGGAPDGTRLVVRPIEAADRDRLAKLFHRMSEESRYRRFLGPKVSLTNAELAYLTDVDHRDHEALVATDAGDGAIVGVARYARVRDRAGVAEMAVEVADSFQGRGIGTMLVALTIERARANGFRLLFATTLWENRAARALLRRYRFMAVESQGPQIDYELGVSG